MMVDLTHRYFGKVNTIIQGKDKKRGGMVRKKDDNGVIKAA